jgi:hypothetical protein
MKLKYKGGDKIICKSDLIMNTGRIAYFKNKIYTVKNIYQKMYTVPDELNNLEHSITPDCMDKYFNSLKTFRNEKLKRINEKY